jgi:suppressor of fused-like protein
VSPDPDVSGWGFELSFRLKRGPKEKLPPEWPLPFLQKLARYVFNTKNPFDHEHYIRWGGPITKDEPTGLEAILFSVDSQLGEIDTPNGSLKFLGVIGITVDEHDFAAEEGPEKLLPQLLGGNALGIVDLGRKSVLG